ncbi:MAG TPA: AbgT family transporter, partial [Phycisphaerales bacterium]|nr:AbgT family transporter [Phycisphaerales bacterium]
VPLILIVFLVPGLVYGLSTGALKTQKDISKSFIYSMEQMAPVLAMAFFAAQFIESFKYSGLDQMLAFVGGDALASSGLPPMLLLVGIVFLTMIVNLLMSSMSAKWTMLAPILVPIMMMVGVSPELTQCAYRVGDSVTNIITPLNTYAIVILAVMQRYNKSAGMGQLIATMLPYSIVFAIFWTIFLVAYIWLGIPQGPGAPMWYAPGH